ncbi:phage Gp37/Gp68 family protein [Acidovorax cavernicola]|uniref:Phage Gp37/Gp68 family protein n=1 Tax=Acidovorax cavernicola TaxID=1675792 RepID=A0A9X8GSL2_9BURK|nr:phage Gp37/Gp68 family protein [Acidovorax cavernicola]RIX74443.1 phage Gp37/Gp68 family protein [Acidovorax cavernicola]
MSANSKIEWTDHTFNPWVGCLAISPGCKHCYAADWAKRYGRDFAARTRTSAANWKMPLRWNAQADAFMAQHGRRQRVFCASLADVFDNAVEREWRDDLATLILNTPNLDWLLLTKRIGNAGDMLGEMFLDGPPDHVWLGATIVDQAEADRDIPKLLGVPAAKRFLSMEPLLGPVRLDVLALDPDRVILNALNGQCGVGFAHTQGDFPSGVDWVIVGGESGAGARPMHPDWVRSLRDQCGPAGVPFLFKQWGEWFPVSQQDEEFTHRLYRSNRKARQHEDQGALDDCYGRTCLVEQAVIHEDSSVHAPLAPMAFLQGTGAMLTFKAGKKAAGRALDGREWDEAPAS